MTDRNMEQQLRQAIENITPDILDDLAKELELKGTPAPDEAVERTMVPMTFNEKRKRRSRIYKSLAGLAAAVLIFIGGYQMFGAKPEIQAVVGLDVNPSVEVSIDKDDRVIEASAFNEEGEDLLSGLDFKGSDINVACNAFVGVMLTKGYLTDTSNSILVSVRAKDEQQGRQLERALSENLNGYLENAEIATAILGQYVRDDEDLELFARENNISSGKAWLIRSLASKDGRMTEESLLKLSTQELILLGQEKLGDDDEDDIYGSVSTSDYISREEALRTAMVDAGLIEKAAGGGSAGGSSANDGGSASADGGSSGAKLEDLVDRYRVDFECDDGVIIYEVEFAAGGIEYSYDLDARSGRILKSEQEQDDDTYGTGSGAGNGTTGGSGGSGSGGSGGSSGSSGSGGSGGSSAGSGGSGSSGGSGGSTPRYDDDDDDDDYDDRYDDDDDDSYDHDDDDDGDDDDGDDDDD